MESSKQLKNKIAEEYWIRKLSLNDKKSKLLTADYDVDNEDIEPVHIDFEKDLVQYLHKTFKGEKATVNKYIIFITALNILYLKYTGEDDVIIGTSDFNFEKLITSTNNLIFFRNKINNKASLKNLVDLVLKDLIECLEYKSYEYEKFIRKYELLNNKASLYNLGIFYDKMNINSKLLESFNILFKINETEENIKLSIQTNQKYDRKLIKYIGDNFINTVKLILNNKNAKIEDITILSENEKDTLFLQFFKSEHNEQIDKTTIELFEEQVDKNPHKIALAFKDVQLTYKHLNQKLNQIAHFLRSKGISSNSLVAVLMDRSIEMILGVMGVLKAGGAYVPLDPEYPQERINYLLNDSNVKLIISKRDISKNFKYTELVNITDDANYHIVTKKRPPITNLDTLPIIDRSLVDYNKYHKYIGMARCKHSITLHATRGCPYHCIYCHDIFPKKNIQRSSGHVFDEIKRSYDHGIKRFVIIDDIFNLNQKFSSEVMEKILQAGMDINIYFPHGLRGDIMSKDYIDLLAEAGTVWMALALETTSDRLQKLMNCNLKIDKFYDNINYIAQKYPHIILGMMLLHGFPTETKEEALDSLETLKSIKWLHYADINVLKIYPNSEMYNFAIKNGISEQEIARSASLLFHELPETLPHPKSFSLQFQTRYLNEYFLLKERLLHVLPHQMKLTTEDELVHWYNSYLPHDIKGFGDILDFADIKKEELNGADFLKEEDVEVPDFSKKIEKYYPKQKNINEGAQKLLLIDLSVFFSSDEGAFEDIVEAPLGLMSLLTYINQELKDEIEGKIIKSKVDFDNFDELFSIINEFQPDIISIRSLSHYSNFVHETIALIKDWNPGVLVILGGPYPSSDYNHAIQDHNIDIAVLGEGEITFLELLQKIIKNNGHLPGNEILQSIPGIAYVPEEYKKCLKHVQRELIYLDINKKIFNDYPADNPAIINKLDDLAFIVYTSGSTGTPKGVLQTHKCLTNVVKRQIDYARMEKGLNILQYMSIGFDASIAHEILFSFLSAGRCILVDNEDRKDLISLSANIIKFQIEFAFLPVSALNVLFEISENHKMLGKTLKHLVSGGEQLYISSYFNNFLACNPHVLLHNFYGPTETHNAANNILDTREEQIAKKQPIGFPTLNAEIVILDKKDQPVPIGAKGELFISGMSVARGYMNGQQITEERFVKHPFKEDIIGYKSGDIGSWYPNGKIEFHNRKDDQIKIRGFRIELAEIERTILRHDVIENAVVVVVEEKEKYLAVYYTAHKDLDSSDLRRYLEMYLPDYMVPTYFKCLDKFPLTVNGKVDKKELPKIELTGKSNYEAPRDELDRAILKIWSEVLEIEEKSLGIIDNFFELGGHSLKATILVSKLNKAFNVKVPLVEIFKKPTIKSCARLLGQNKKIKFKPILPAANKGHYVLSPTQKRIYLVQQKNLNSIAYNVTNAWTFTGEIDIHKMQKAIQTLINNHEALRTSFVVENGQIVQKIHDEIRFSIEVYNTIETEINSKIQEFVRPFKLAEAPLIRAALLNISKAKSILVIDIHHINIDGISFNIFIERLFELYNGKKDINPKTIQYKDYCEWLSSGDNNKIFEKQKKFWLNAFSDGISPLKLPLDKIRSDKMSFNGDIIGFEINSVKTGKVQELAKKENTTMFMLLLSIYKILLSKLSNQQDIIVGTPIAGRNHEDIQNIIGNFLNTLAIKSSPVSSKIFKEYLQEVKQSSIAAYENQDLPFEEVVNLLVPNIQQNRNPIYDVMFELQNYKTHKRDNLTLEKGKINVEQYELEYKSSKVDLTLFGVETPDTLKFGFMYNTDLFYKESVGLWAIYFETILDIILDNPNILIRDIKMGQESVSQLDVLSDILEEE